MLIDHRGKRPSIHESAFVAPSAVVCGDVRIGPHSQIAFGAVIVAQGGPVVIGTQSIIRENAVIRATPQHSVEIGNDVLVGPNASLYGCVVEDEAFLATGVTIFHGARIGKRAEVRINGVVHVNSILPEKAMVPIGWVAVGDPAQVLPPNEHERIWAIQKSLNFPFTAYGVERSPDGSVDMKEITRRLAESLAEHRHDLIIPVPSLRSAADERNRSAPKRAKPGRIPILSPAAQKAKKMKMEQYIRAIAGTLILVSVGLGWFHSKYWLLFTAFVGLNLLQSAFTKWCLMEDILAKLGLAEKPRCKSEITESEGQGS